MNVLDLFCGCGGFSLGAHNAGFKVKLAIDIDPILTSSYNKNFPDVSPLLADISKLSAAEIRAKVDGPIDGICGGPPCQGFSDIGRHIESDPRRELLGHFFRLVADLSPTFFIMENVRGLAYRGARELLDKGISHVEARYNILGPIILDAADFGAATRRRRLFVLGFRRSHAGVLSPTELIKAQRPAATVRGAIADLTASKYVDDDDDGFDQWRIGRSGRPSEYAARLRSPTGQFTGHQKVKHTRAVAKRFGLVAPGEVDNVGRHPRLKWSGLCPTLRAGTGNDRGSYQAVRPIHPDEPRVITVREAARLQGFPDDFHFHPTVWHSFRMIGNSVSPIIAGALFSVIRNHIEAGAAVPRAAE